MFYSSTIAISTDSLHPPYLPIHNPPIPQPLPEVPTLAGDAIEETEFEEVADAEVGDGAEIARQFEILCFARGPNA